MRVPTASENLARAYAALGLAPDSSPRETLRQYKRLVKRWHPDRHARDPQGHAEASQRMRDINAAFAVIRPTLARPEPRPSTASMPRASDRRPVYESTFGARLRPDDVDAIVDSMAGPSMVETFFQLVTRLNLIVGTIVLLGMGNSYRGVNSVAAYILAAVALVLTVRTLERDRSVP